MSLLNLSPVYVDPMVNVNYASFYILGLYQKFGKDNIIFTNKPFKQLALKSRVNCLNFVINDKKYTIDFGELNSVKPDVYAWCDVYGHVNANVARTPEKFRGKLVSLAPYFGVKLYSHIDSALYAWKNMWKTMHKTLPFTLVQRYRKQCRYRVYYEEYEKKSAITENAVFHLSSVWLNEDWHRNDEAFNEANAHFITACKSIPELVFDGGLSFAENVKCSPSLKKLKCKGSVSVKDYLEKTAQSLLAFSAPYSNGSHGWKLGEYLALGKAIISTPLVNDLPAPLVHGENIHFVENDEKSMREAVLLIMRNKTYREKLEKGARAYWEKYGTPAKALELLGITS